MANFFPLYTLSIRLFRTDLPAELILLTNQAYGQTNISKNPLRGLFTFGYDAHPVAFASGCFCVFA